MSLQDIHNRLETLDQGQTELKQGQSDLKQGQAALQNALSAIESDNRDILEILRSQSRPG